MSGDFWQLLLVDLLFLALVGSIGLWFRSWLRSERVHLDERLETLDRHQADLERLANRLQSACQRLEVMAAVPTEWPPALAKGRRELTGDGTAGNAGAAASQAPNTPRRGGRRDDREELYDRAREMRARGHEPGMVARQLGLGVAEVELMERILRQNTPR